MGIICDTCGRDIDALGQDNMGVDAPLCEDCWNERQSYANDLRRAVRDLRFENARLREKLDAATEETAATKATKFAAGAAQDAAMPCLKAEEARGFAMPDVNVEVKAEVTAEEFAKSLRESMKPAMRMAVE